MAKPQPKPDKKVVTKNPGNDRDGQQGHDQNQRPADGLHRYGRKA